MKLLITNIDPERANEACNNIKIIYDDVYLIFVTTYSNLFYLRINDSKMSHGTMSYLSKIDNSITMHSNDGFERIDYEEWYKKNEVSITAIKFGLL